MVIRYTTHAREGFEECATLGFIVTPAHVEEVITSPDRVDTVSCYPQTVAQRWFDEKHVLRVVYRYECNYALVITLYIGRRKQYER